MDSVYSQVYVSLKGLRGTLINLTELLSIIKQITCVIGAGTKIFNDHEKVKQKIKHTTHSSKKVNKNAISKSCKQSAIYRLNCNVYVIVS